MVVFASYQMCHKRVLVVRVVCGATVRRISPFCCRMPTYQQCRKTPSQKLRGFSEEDFMVSISFWYINDKILPQKIIGSFMIVAMLFCISECPRGHPYMVGDVSTFKILFVTC